MKHYVITLTNGGYPLVYKCNTIASAYGCVEELVCRMPMIGVDLNDTMEALVDMERGKTLKYGNYQYLVEVKDGEA